MTNDHQYSPRAASCDYQYSNTTTLHCEVHGAGSQHVLLLHGFGASLETWRDVLPFISRDATFYLVDLKGFGLSSKPRDAQYSPETQAEIVASFLKHHNITSVTLVGHSYGAAVALLTLFRLQDQPAYGTVVRSLVLIDAAAYRQRLPFFVASLRNPVTRFVALSLMSARARASFTLNRIFYDKTKVDAMRVDRYARFFALPEMDYSLTQAARQIVPANADYISERIKSIRVPTLVVWGREDPVIDLAQGHRLRADIVGAEECVIPEAGHVPHEEQPRAVGRAIASFLARF